MKTIVMVDTAVHIDLSASDVCHHIDRRHEPQLVSAISPSSEVIWEETKPKDIIKHTDSCINCRGCETLNEMR